jgi:predicted thioesterase
MYFADYRDVDGLKLPFRIRRAVGGDTTEETTFDRFRINARIDAKRFEVGN